MGCFRDDESGAGPLSVIQRAQRGGHVAGARAASGQGRHDDTVRQRERSYFDGGEEIPRGLSGGVLHEAILLRREDVNGTTPFIAVTQSLRVCPLCVNSVGSNEAAASPAVRFTPRSGQTADVSICPLCCADLTKMTRTGL